MERTFVILAGAFGLLGVAAGAFGAHGLREQLSADMLDIWNTAAHYQLVHAAALLGAAWAVGRFPGRWTVAAGWLFAAGVVVFSGTLYLLAITGVGWLGAITPLGGTAFILGWAALAVAAARGGGR